MSPNYLLGKKHLNLLGSFLILLSLTELLGQSTDHIQESRYKPFRVLIISPDTAQIHEELILYTDSIEQEFQTSYYSMLREIERRRTYANDIEKADLELAARKARWYEMDVVKFKYYHSISVITCVSLSEYFQKYPWEDKESLECQIVYRDDLETEDLEVLTREFDFDYVIYFQDIIAEKYADSFILDMTTILYSKTDAKVIMEKKVFKEGDQLFCRFIQQNLLACMFTRVINETTSNLFEVLNERQKR